MSVSWEEVARLLDVEDGTRQHGVALSSLASLAMTRLKEINVEAEKDLQARAEKLAKEQKALAEKTAAEREATAKANKDDTVELTEEQERAKAAKVAKEQHDREEEQMKAARARALGPQVEVPQPERRA